MPNPSAWHQASYAVEAAAKMMKRIHANMGNPDCTPWYMGVNRAVDISGCNNVVVFPEDILKAFQHILAGAWVLPVDYYKQVNADTVVCRPSPNEFTNCRREFVIERVSGHLTAYPMFTNGEVIEVLAITGGIVTMSVIPAFW